ncbi:hypothetical protein L3X38_018001 [Prunus dulcis]|uniref:Uncharacterized protein n=1 Tax=Prunus dulcis TaxID=3755 RepID=A0AAD4W8E5_PRUDU|nr:hypothetical protein L3X38_018001 [Prunus dulcis]
MNPSYVVYGVCMRDCGVEGYGSPQGPRKLLDDGDFGLATWEHQSPSPLLRVLQCLVLANSDKGAMKSSFITLWRSKNQQSPDEPSDEKDPNINGDSAGD